MYNISHSIIGSQGQEAKENYQNVSVTVIWGKVDHKWLTILAKVKPKKTAMTSNLTPQSPRMGAWTSYKKINKLYDGMFLQ